MPKEIRNAIRVLTWNVLCRDREERTNLLVDRISRVGPDVVLLQETSPAHAADVAARLDMELVVCGRPDLSASAASVPAVLCRTNEVVALGDPFELVTKERCFVVGSRVRHSAGPELVLGSVHLTHTHHAGQLGFEPGYVRLSTGRGEIAGIVDDTLRVSVSTRLEQLVELKQTVVAESGMRGVVLGGDYNFITYGAEYQWVVANGFGDAWSQGPRLGSRDTILEYNPLILDGLGVYADRPHGALDGATGPLDYTLDFQFVTPDLFVSGAWTVGRPDSNDPEWVSDHLGVVVDYSLLMESG